MTTRGVRVQRAILALLPSLGVTQESLAAHLSAAWGRGVDRTLVTHWRAGSRPMPVDAVPELVRHASAEDGAPEEDVAERVLGVLARDVGCIVLRLPQGTARASELTTRLLALGGALGRIQHELAVALEDGELDDEERQRMAAQLRALITEATRVLHQVEPAALDAHTTAAPLSLARPR